MKHKSVSATFPGAAYWIELGLHGRTARGLARAGYRTLDDLKGKSREELLAIPALGEGMLAVCERLLGSAFPSRIEELEEHGISPFLSHALVRAGFDSWEKVQKLTREQCMTVNNLGSGRLRELEAVLGRRLDSPTRDLCRQGLQRPTAYRLAGAGIRDVQELADRPDEVLRSLGLNAEDIAACRRLIRKAGKGRR
ncbi:MAG: helix-hairpin-helix domain-containing protein [Thermoanaerobaculia bacterium]